jgi:hypothetical protein
MAETTLNLGFLKVRFTKEQVAAAHSRLRRKPLYGGPCLLVERASGRALDVTPDAKPGERAVLWTVHGGPWQRWNIRPVGGGQVQFVSEHRSLALTAVGTPGDWSPVRLEEPTAGDRHQRWRLRPTDDGAAFLIESVMSPHALDATDAPENLTVPQLWSSHWAEWQQWVIARLPIR